MPTRSQSDLKVALTHILWIGGATASGKTSVARVRAEKHGLQVYHYDLYDRVTPPGHWARADPARHPLMYPSPVEDRDWMWVDTTPARARHNHIGCDLLLAEHLRQRAGALEMTSVEIDGTLSLAEIVSVVEAHFGPFLG